MFKEAHAMRNGQYVQSIGRTVQREAGWQAVRPSSPGTAGQGPCEDRCGCSDVPNGLCSFLGEAWLCVAVTVERSFAASLFWSETLMYVPEIPRLNQRHCDFSLTFPHLKNAFIHIYTHMYCYWTKWRELIKRHRHPWRSLLFFFEHFQSAGCVLLHLAAQQATAPPPEPAGPDLTLPVAGSAG